MIERFNFYDVYGYLIPGFVGLLAAALPFVLASSFDGISAVELTGALIISYVAGHAISGVARIILPTERYSLEGEEKRVQLSVWWLSPQFIGKNPPAAKEQLADLFKERFGFDPLRPFNAGGVKAMFFMCRTALIQAKLASYVEQYQGMSSMTQGVAAVACVAPAYYSAWVVSSSLTRLFEPVDFRHVLPLMTLAIGVVLADFVSRALDKEAEAEGDEIMMFELGRTECQVVVVALIVAGAIGGIWYPLSPRDNLQLAIAAVVIFLLALRFKSAFLEFEQAWVRGIFYDFVALASTPRPPGPYPKPDDD